MPRGHNSAHDPRRRVDIRPHHRQAALDAIRQAAEKMDTSPEAFRVSNYTPHNGHADLELELHHEPWRGYTSVTGEERSNTPTRSLHRFEIGGAEPVYRRVLEQAQATHDVNDLVDLSDPRSHGEMRWQTFQAIDPTARQRRGIIDQYEWKKQGWVPQRNWKEIAGSMEPDWALGKNYLTGKEEPYFDE